jgi:hypothetical protein
MAKKHKSKSKKAMKKAKRAVTQHGGLAAFMAALSGLATSVIASKALRRAVASFVSDSMGRASLALESRHDRKRHRHEHDLPDGVAAHA